MHTCLGTDKYIDMLGIFNSSLEFEALSDEYLPPNSICCSPLRQGGQKTPHIPPPEVSGVKGPAKVKVMSGDNEFVILSGKWQKTLLLVTTRGQVGGPGVWRLLERCAPQVLLSIDDRIKAERGRTRGRPSLEEAELRGLVGYFWVKSPLRLSRIVYTFTITILSAVNFQLLSAGCLIWLFTGLHFCFIF